MLYGRTTEEYRISSLLSDAARGRSGAVAIVGAPGEGKSALLRRAEDLVGPEWRILRCTGMETEAELPFCSLRQLLEPALHHLDSLPGPQQQALSGALGLKPAESPERFLVGLATLSLLAELSAEGPVLCLVDDAQWVDQSSMDALLFTARRLGREGIAVLFAGRPRFTATGLEVLHPTPLNGEQARALLDEHYPRLPMEIRDRVLAEAAGNPLALRELPSMNLDALPVGPLELSERLRSGYADHIADLPAGTRLALLVAAADESGDLALVLRVLAALGSNTQALADAECTGMITISGQSVAFRHPLIRAAAYRFGTDAERVTVHAEMADALRADPDRRAWHLAAATIEPDETVAAALESAAERAGDRTGYGASATAWERAARLTPDPAQRARRLVNAVEKAVDAGQFCRVRRLARAARELTVDPMDRSRLATALAHVEYEHGSPREAHRVLRRGAAAIAPVDPERAAVMLLEAGRFAWAAGDLDALRMARDMLRELPASPNRERFLVAYEGTLGLYDEDPSAGIALVRDNISLDQWAGHREPGARFILATQARVIGDIDTARTVLTELAENSRLQGGFGWLAAFVLWLGTIEIMAGRLREAELLSVEGLRIGEDLGQPVRIAHAATNLAVISAIAGDEERCLEVMRTHIEHPDLASIHRIQFDWALAILDMSLGRFDTALTRMEALEGVPTKRQAQWLLIYADRVEAAVRIGAPERAREPLAALRLWSDALRAPWAEGLLLRSLGVLNGDPESFARAMEAHAVQRRWYDRARTGLLYGGWLRLHHRGGEARGVLREAWETFERLGARAWADRARDELRAAGEGLTPEVKPELVARLTPQELQVVRLAATGATNKEIAARLFLSPKTVGHHLSRAFRKLGVSGRVELVRLELD